MSNCGRTCKSAVSILRISLRYVSSSARIYFRKFVRVRALRREMTLFSSPCAWKEKTHMSTCDTQYPLSVFCLNLELLRVCLSALNECTDESFATHLGETIVADFQFAVERRAQPLLRN